MPTTGCSCFLGFGIRPANPVLDRCTGKAGRNNTYLGSDETERSLARSLVYGVSQSSGCTD